MDVILLLTVTTVLMGSIVLHILEMGRLEAGRLRLYSTRVNDKLIHALSTVTCCLEERNIFQDNPQESQYESKQCLKDSSIWEEFLPSGERTKISILMTERKFVGNGMRKM